MVNSGGATGAASVTQEDVFALLEHFLSRARPRLGKARPIAFIMLPGGEQWVFDPRSKGTLFARSTSPVPSGVLRLRCAPQLLARLITDPAFELSDEDDASYEGNIEDLVALAAAFDESRRGAR